MSCGIWTLVVRGTFRMMVASTQTVLQSWQTWKGNLKCVEIEDNFSLPLIIIKMLNLICVIKEFFTNLCHVCLDSCQLQLKLYTIWTMWHGVQLSVSSFLYSQLIQKASNFLVFLAKRSGIRDIKSTLYFSERFPLYIIIIYQTSLWDCTNCYKNRLN